MAELAQEQQNDYWIPTENGGYRTKNDRTFPFLCQPDFGDEMDNRNTWLKANPHLGITVYDEFYQTALAKAHRSHEDLMEFMTKNLNEFVRDERKQWFSLEEANALMNKEADFFAESQYMGDCVVAVDLMEVGDMCAVCYFGFNCDTKVFRAHLEYYMPEDCIDTHANKYLYREWHQQGWLNLTKGRVIDAQLVADNILERGIQMEGRLKRIRYDAAFAKDLSNRLKTTPGIPPDCVRAIAQTMLNYTQAMAYFDVIRDDPQMGGLVVDYNPIFAWNLSNCTIITNRNGLRMPDKGRGAENKIDGADALLMCIFDAQQNI